MTDSKNSPMFIPGPAPAEEPAQESEAKTAERNPTFIPAKTVIRRCCPKCKGEEFSGRNIQGTVTFTCKSCHNQWQGGMGLPEDPRVPRPTESYVPPMAFEQGGTKETRGKIVEVRRPVDLRADFRKGAPDVPDEEL